MFDPRPQHHDPMLHVSQHSYQPNNTFKSDTNARCTTFHNTTRNCPPRGSRLWLLLDGITLSPITLSKEGYRYKRPTPPAITQPSRTSQRRLCLAPCTPKLTRFNHTSQHPAKCFHHNSIFGRGLASSTTQVRRTQTTRRPTTKVPPQLEILSCPLRRLPLRVCCQQKSTHTVLLSRNLLEESGLDLRPFGNLSCARSSLVFCRDRLSPAYSGAKK